MHQGNDRAYASDAHDAILNSFVNAIHVAHSYFPFFLPLGFGPRRTVSLSAILNLSNSLLVIFWTVAPARATVLMRLFSIARYNAAFEMPKSFAACEMVRSMTRIMRMVLEWRQENNSGLKTPTPRVIAYQGRRRVNCHDSREAKERLRRYYQKPLCASIKIGYYARVNCPRSNEVLPILHVPRTKALTVTSQDFTLMRFSTPKNPQQQNQRRGARDSFMIWENRGTETYLIGQRWEAGFTTTSRSL